MTSPYINTKLYTSVILHPYQMNNKIYINLKKNLENKVAGKCFLKYGYINKVIEIVGYNDGIIEAENTESSALYDVEFSCKLCAPLKNMKIICQIERINKLLITAINGPILIIITSERINDKIFFKDNNNNIRYKHESQSLMLKPQDFIKVTLQTIKFDDGDVKIKAIGFIDDIATSEEKEKYYNDQYKDADEIIPYEQYVESNQTTEEVNEEITE
jgi:DNA-directed RNA polymerase subunit E'/Rpb7